MKKFIKLTLRIIPLMILVYSCKQSVKPKISNSAEKVVFTPPVSELEALATAESIVTIMTIEEKLNLIKGHKAFFIKGFEKYGLPDVYLTDASQGVHIRNNPNDTNLAPYILPKSVAFPNVLELTATWNPKIAHDYAKSIGEECKAAGIGVLLGPGLNIYRNSQNGRNFEYMGEDPYLASRMVEQYVLGLQNTGTIATLKHFLGNNTDYKRRASNSVIDERTLHEIYMPAFKSGINAGAMAVMTSYNLVNGEWSGQSDYVINNLLRNQLGFKNLVMTDWWSVNDCKKLVKSGQDLEMPGGESMANLKTYIENGEIAVTDINRMCISIIKTLTQMGFLNNPIKDTTYLNNFDQHEQVALQTAREGIVLLRNNNNMLPIEKGSSKNILLTGMYVTENIYGGGSGEVAGYNQVTILDALKNLYPNLIYKKNATESEIQKADIVLVSVGTFDYEGCDRHFALSKEQEALVQFASNKNKNTLVIVNSGGGIRMADWTNVQSIIYNWYPGQMGNLALAEILCGETNPSGKLPMTIEKEFKDSPAYGYIPDTTSFMCDAENYLDINIQEPELNRWDFDTDIRVAHENLYNVHYNEGVLVGYRWFDTKNIEPLFPFGFGLSYTHFSITDAELSDTIIYATQNLTVRLKVSNNGNQKGATVVQLYVREKNPSVIRPDKELKAFKKVWLDAGESTIVDFILDKDAFAYWNDNTKEWTTNNGEFDILIGQSSRDISQVKSLTMK